MNLKALRYAVEVARVGSFTVAAQRLYIAQSALSMAISRLESELGVPLFNRVGKRISLTAEGGRFLERVGHLLQGLNVARQELTDLSQLQVGEVRLGFAPMFGMGRLPDWLEGFHALYPGVLLTAIEGGGQEVSRRLDAREIDLGLMDSRRVREHWESVPVDSDELLICVRPDHDLAGRQCVQPEDLQGLKMAVLDERFAQRVMLDEYCKPRKLEYPVALQSNDAPLIIQGSQRGLGATTLFRSNLHAAPGLVGVPFNPPQRLHFSLCWRAGEYLSLANRRFVEFVKEFSRDQVQAHKATS